ncbi:hypothetical protein J4E86_009540 [Alternaria arbusti]|uniref:uncharacterized protein n=1 Tax=Alternaria arbusti TaxID=232088 RepID=UPI002220316A|nr:uncharacterized protein J4E86_009540 [Alternaria arbusti]KAI4944481.1 hypothetical protein J4E86_009540 [Alternaria arbusti]
MQINNCYLELKEDVVQKLINARLEVEDVSEEWLQAQLLLRGFGRPGEELHWTKRNMISRLAQIIPILEDKYYIITSKEYLKNNTPHNASRCWCFATQRKNLLTKKTLPATVTKPKPNVDRVASPAPENEDTTNINNLKTSAAHKRPRPNAAELGEASNHPHKRQRLPSPNPEADIDNGECPSSLIAPTSGAPPTPPEDVDHLPREVAGPLRQASMSLSAIGEEHWKFKLHDYMGHIAGTYMILCPLLAERHPDLIGQLSITIKYLGASSLASGILEAYFNLGTFTGPAILGLDDGRIAEWLWATATERRGRRAPPSYNNAEVKRLCEDALDLAMERTPERNRANVETRHLRDLPALDIDTTALPQLLFDARLENPSGEYYGSGTYCIA